jgi:transposase InsO family protein
MPLYPVRALERAMKIKEVITRAMSGQINWLQAAEIIGITDRSMRRWRKRLSTGGYGDLLDGRTRQPSAKRIDMAVVEKVLRLYREKYFDLNVKHFVEKLHGQEQISLSYTWVKTALQNAGLVKRYAKRGPHRKKRPRRPLTGMMLHVDGSRHRWIPGLDQYQDLIVIFDDATSEVYDVKLVNEESTTTVMDALKRVIETRGLFCSLYSDRGSHMAWTPKAGEPVHPQNPTQIARALAQVGIELILAYSPQARGRCERLFGTWQGRLPQELRLRHITTVEAANEFLRQDWIGMHDASFSVQAEQTGTAFLPYPGNDLDKIFSQQHQRVVDNDNTVRFEGRCLQIPQQTFRFSLARCRVLVCEHLDQSISVHYGHHVLGRYDAAGQTVQLAGQSKLRHRADRRGIMKAEAHQGRQSEERKKNQKRKKRAA